VFIGDSYERDIVPALAEGMCTVHYSEKGGLSLESVPFKINSL
jgi:FMN phosphatase YigB (HAD superfamily)